MEISDALFVAKLATLTYSDCITCLGTVAVKTHFIFLKVTITSQIPYHYDARISYSFTAFIKYVTHVMISYFAAFLKKDSVSEKRRRPAKLSFTKT